MLNELISVLSFVNPLWETGDEDEDDEESSCYSSDSDYEAMFSNAPLMKISLADLQRLSEESQQTFETAAPKKATTPEQILASILEDARKDELKEKKTAKKTGVKMTLPPFRGTRALREEEEGRGEGNEVQKLDSDVPQLNQRMMDGTLSRQRDVEHGESSAEDEENDASGALKPLPDKPEDGAALSQQRVSAKDPEKVAPSAHHSEASSTEQDEEEAQGEKQASSQRLFKPKDDVEQQRKDNLRRLAAIQQRQEEAEEHKKVIQSALAKLVSYKRRKIYISCQKTLLKILTFVLEFRFSDLCCQHFR